MEERGRVSSFQASPIVLLGLIYQGVSGTADGTFLPTVSNKKWNFWPSYNKNFFTATYFKFCVSVYSKLLKNYLPQSFQFSQRLVKSVRLWIFFQDQNLEILDFRIFKTFTKPWIGVVTWKSLNNWLFYHHLLAFSHKNGHLTSFLGLWMHYINQI